MNGAFPPSSNASLLTPDELCLYSNFPTAVEPKSNKYLIHRQGLLLIKMLIKQHVKNARHNTWT
jgi:hypothetical protein